MDSVQYRKPLPLPEIEPQPEYTFFQPKNGGTSLCGGSKLLRNVSKLIQCHTAKSQKTILPSEKLVCPLFLLEGGGNNSALSSHLLFLVKNPHLSTDKLCLLIAHYSTLKLEAVSCSETSVNFCSAISSHLLFLMINSHLSTDKFCLLIAHYSTLNLEAISCSETSVNIYRFIRRHVLGDTSPL
jgi:hypothetical protein